MDFIYEYFQVYIFKITRNKVFICQNFDIPNIEITSLLTSHSEISGIDFKTTNLPHYHQTIPIDSANKLIISLQPQPKADTINTLSLAYRACNILLQNADKFVFKPSISVSNNSHSNQKSLSSIEEIMSKHFPHTKNKISLPDLIYIRLIAANCTSDVISKIIGRSSRTVEDKVNKIYKKLKCHSRRELIELCNYVSLEFINKTLSNASKIYSTI